VALPCVARAKSQPGALLIHYVVYFIHIQYKSQWRKHAGNELIHIEFSGAGSPKGGHALPHAMQGEAKTLEIARFLTKAKTSSPQLRLNKLISRPIRGLHFPQNPLYCF
jgi:hypothetical protein